MDDEAGIRITAIIVTGVLLAGCAFVFGLGWARNRVPISTAQAQVQTIKTVTNACEELPTSEMGTCISAATRALAQRQALAYCGGLIFGIPEELCLAEVTSGRIGTLQEQALATCDDMMKGQ